MEYFNHLILVIGQMLLVFASGMLFALALERLFNSDKSGFFLIGISLVNIVIVFLMLM